MHEQKSTRWLPILFAAVSFGFGFLRLLPQVHKLLAFCKHSKQVEYEWDVVVPPPNVLIAPLRTLSLHICKVLLQPAKARCRNLCGFAMD